MACRHPGVLTFVFTASNLFELGMSGIHGVFRVVHRVSSNYVAPIFATRVNKRDLTVTGLTMLESMI